ncbi:MAG TPA: tol-pal system-associated acyl-CoA thioesterase [Agitococcus sp.]|jgi:tol-pal system-associated acyl-CoA thioesterase|nr:tol-pal system-associated acyl-CoA thioesterase [Agitococcus sp.]HMV61317.1 tol-pal system-associated acyl-CoA thioesterase [Agitococcus sp.]HMY00349.1 tol-pal system-associated acyl-CoA thioesterase [Agitococcus sp.]HMY82717.1 tol-pal system-associated acyl-CoA thioesterase [Agitococcus sp.]HNA22460.1 tol-pal system-associated acyl-CoA thioesterase [Agitococcus sp.]
MTVFSLNIRVYIEDTDAAGIVYYVNYLKFMERARTEYLRHIGFGHYLLTEDYLFVVRKAQIDYKQPAKMDDELRVTAQIIKQGKASLLFEQCIYRQDTLLSRAEIDIACVAKQSLKPCALPTRLTELLTK